MLKSAIYSGGKQQSALPANDRGVCYGDGLFTTVRIQAGERVLWSLHWQRLIDGCVRLGISPDTQWPEQIAAFCQGVAYGVLRIQITRGAGGRGYQWPVPAQPSLILTLHELSDTSHNAQHGIRLGDTALRLAQQPRLAGLKHSNRLEQVLLRQELAEQPDCQEALVLDTQDQVIEGVFSNLFCFRDGQWLTPELSQSGVAGVLREFLLAHWQAQGIPVSVCSLRREDLLHAEEICLGNSLNGLWPVCHWAGRSWQIGAQTRQSQHDLAAWYPMA